MKTGYQSCIAQIHLKKSSAMASNKTLLGSCSTNKEKLIGYNN